MVRLHERKVSGCVGWSMAAVSVFVGAAQAGDEDLDALLDVDTPLSAVAPGLYDAGTGLRFSGFGEFAGAYAYDGDAHWSKLRARMEVGASGPLTERIKFKVSTRLEGDAAYGLFSHHYPAPVRRDQRYGATLREAYLDFSAGDWEFRLGRQHVVWGEVVGLFVADVVSAKDWREFYLPEFESMRIPQWAARAEYFAGDTHLEWLWVPVAGYDEVGKPGAEFFPYPLPDDTHVEHLRPSRALSKSSWGMRASRLMAGWDVSLFYYQSQAVSPTLYVVEPGRYQWRHDRIKQLGATFSKDFGEFVLKGEIVDTRGRRYPVMDEQGFAYPASSRVTDYVLGVDVPLASDWRVNVQYFGSTLDDHDRRMLADKREHGVTFQAVHQFSPKWEAELLYVSMLGRSDHMLRPKLIWHLAPAWRGIVGADIFGGGAEGVFGRFDDRDRVYVELRRWF